MAQSPVKMIKKMTANAGDLDLQSRKFKYKNMIQIDLFLNNEDI